MRALHTSGKIQPQEQAGVSGEGSAGENAAVEESEASTASAAGAASTTVRDRYGGSSLIHMPMLLLVYMDDCDNCYLDWISTQAVPISLRIHPGCQCVPPACRLLTYPTRRLPYHIYIYISTYIHTHIHTYMQVP